MYQDRKMLYPSHGQNLAFLYHKRWIHQVPNKVLSEINDKSYLHIDDNLRAGLGHFFILPKLNARGKMYLRASYDVSIAPGLVVSP
ncbi:hypothetical protein Plhal710r2_c020g0086231 [Plasmopara halstedii]